MAKKGKRKELFQKPRNKYLANIVSFKSHFDAVVAREKLKSEFRNAKTLPKKLRIARATNYASNRAMAMSKKKGLTTSERAKLKKVSNDYKSASRSMFLRYDQLKGKK